MVAIKKKIENINPTPDIVGAVGFVYTSFRKVHLPSSMLCHCLEHSQDLIYFKYILLVGDF